MLAAPGEAAMSHSDPLILRMRLRELERRVADAAPESSPPGLIARLRARPP